MLNHQHCGHEIASGNEYHSKLTVYDKRLIRFVKIVPRSMRSHTDHLLCQMQQFAADLVVLPVSHKVNPYDS